MNTPSLPARLLGICFLVSFLSYGLGSGMITSVTETENILANVGSHTAQILSGVVFIVIVHTLANIVLTAILFSVLKQYSLRLGLTYYTASMTATIFLALGGICSWLLIPLHNTFVQNASNAAYFQALANFCIKGNYVLYQVGMALWGLGGLAMCYVLVRSGIVPRVLALAGVAGYCVFIAGTALELCGFPYGVQMSIPGGLFEIALSVWCIVKGFAQPVNRTVTI